MMEVHDALFYKSDETGNRLIYGREPLNKCQDNL